MTSKTVPAFVTYGAMYYDKNDAYDTKQYLYWSFIMNNKVEMIRMLVSSTTPRIDWSWEFYLFNSTQATDLYRR
jgi:hypothetical protein